MGPAGENPFASPEPVNPESLEQMQFDETITDIEDVEDVYQEEEVADDFAIIERVDVSLPQPTKKVAKTKKISSKKKHKAPKGCHAKTD